MGKVLLILSKSSKQITRLSVSESITSLLGILGIYSFIFGTLERNLKIPFPIQKTNLPYIVHKAQAFRCCLCS